jgi:hypothetical protein
MPGTSGNARNVITSWMTYADRILSVPITAHVVGATAYGAPDSWGGANRRRRRRAMANHCWFEHSLTTDRVCYL